MLLLPAVSVCLSVHMQKKKLKNVIEVVDTNKILTDLFHFRNILVSLDHTFIIKMKKFRSKVDTNEESKSEQYVDSSFPFPIGCFRVL